MAISVLATRPWSNWPMHELEVLRDELELRDGIEMSARFPRIAVHERSTEGSTLHSTAATASLVSSTLHWFQGTTLRGGKDSPNSGRYRRELQREEEI